MLFELIATFAAGFVAAGTILLLNHLSGKRLPKWLMPACAGLAMIGYAIWSEYSWHDRAVAALPQGFERVQSYSSSAFWRPWTFAFPMRDRFVVVDATSLKMHPAAPEQRVVDLFFYARWAAPQPVSVAFDCAAGASAPLIEGAQLTAEGGIEGVTWVPEPPDDPALRHVCTRLDATIPDPA